MTSTTSSPAIPRVARRPTQGLAERARAEVGTTPGRYRLWSVAGVVLLAVAIVATAASGAWMRSSTRRAETNSGPVLVASQQVVSSLAEADAAATGAYLSGRDEDPEQRRLYEQALARTGQQIDDIASLAGQDPAIRAVVGRISVQVTQFAGLVEAARASNRAGSPEATGYLVAAIRLADQLVRGDVRVVADAAQANLRDDEGRRTRGLTVAWIILLLALMALVAAQVAMVSSFRRVLNVPLILATILGLIGFGWLARANQASGRALAAARLHGYNSIVLTAQLGNSGFGAKTAETLAVITGDTAQRGAADADAAQVAAAPITQEAADLIRHGVLTGVPGGLIKAAAAAADSPREWAAVAEAGQRWQRYQDTVAALRAAPGPAAAKAIAVGPANSDFNGFNFSVEAVLGQNRDQFLGGLANAANQTSRVPSGVPLLLLGALIAMVWGFQVRINEYR